MLLYENRNSLSLSTKSSRLIVRKSFLFHLPESSGSSFSSVSLPTIARVRERANYRPISKTSTSISTTNRRRETPYGEKVESNNFLFQHDRKPKKYTRKTRPFSNLSLLHARGLATTTPLYNVAEKSLKIAKDDRIRFLSAVYV